MCKINYVAGLSIVNILERSDRLGGFQLISSIWEEEHAQGKKGTVICFLQYASSLLVYFKRPGLYIFFMVLYLYRISCLFSGEKFCNGNCHGMISVKVLASWAGWNNVSIISSLQFYLL